MRKNFKTPLVAALFLSAAVVPVNRAYAAEDSSVATMTDAQAPSANPAPAASEKRTVTGVVSDANDGEPLIGATVQIEGDKTAITTTDIDGKFTLTFAPKKDATILITYIGYKARKVPVENIGTFDIKMTPEDNSLGEVVVVGSGTQKKVSVTGAISAVKGDALKMNASTLTNNLAGKFAGVFANNTTGRPGSGAEFYIRGISNFTGTSTTPLILLDDVEISSGDLNYVPAENIESFSVLKDASATAIYGARGANGVMIITTKGGDYNAKTNINVSVENSFNFMHNMPEYIDGPTFMELYNKAQYARNPLETPRFTQEQIDRTRSGENPYLYPNIDWNDVMFKKMNMRQRANVNVSGGGSKVKYYMSLELQHEDGNLNTEKLYSWNNNINIYNYTFQNNISYKLTPTTTVSMNMNAQIRQSSQPNMGNNSVDAWFYWARTSSPVAYPIMYPAREGYDNYLFGTYLTAGNENTGNLYANMNTSYWQSNSNTINTVIKINQDLDMITKNLKLQAWVNFKNWSTSSYNRSIAPYLYVASADVDYSEEAWRNPIFPLRQVQEGAQYISQSDISKGSDNTFELQANVNWMRNFDGHEISAMALYRMREYRNGVLPNRNQGFSGRLTYDYNHRYLAEFNFGYNGTERLAKGHRFGFFPAGSLGWVVSSEDFWKELPISNVLTFLKVRGSYGLVGSDEIQKVNGNYFLYFDQITNNNLQYLRWKPATGGSLGYGAEYGGPEMSYYAVRDLGWEKVKKLDIGADIRLFNDVEITVDWFRDRRYNIFIQRNAFPSSLGYGAVKPWSPIGEAENRGLEASVKYTKAINSDLSVSFTGNITYNENKLINSDELNYPYAWQRSTGLPLSYQRGYIAEGLFKSQEEIDNSPVQNLGSQVMVGDIKYRDLNGDGKIDSDDQTMISEYGTTPRLQYGFGATANWKKWDFGFFFTGTGKRTISIADSVDPFQEQRSPRNTLTWVAENYFDPDKGNFDAAYPRLGISVQSLQNNQVNSTYWLRNGSFMRLKNVEIGWRFPLGRIYVAGNNLLNFSSFKLWDPELYGFWAYPIQKSVNVGVQFNL